MLTVIYGGMFSEKTTELLRRGKRFKRAGKTVMYIKPDFDTRYGTNEIVTHEGAKENAIMVPVNEPHKLIELVCENQTDVVLIDEVQFFSNDVLPVIYRLLNLGVIVIVAGLDMDYQTSPFEITATLAAKAEEVVKLHAVCSECGNDAWISHKEENGKRLELGTEIYKPMCRKCHLKIIKGR